MALNVLGFSGIVGSLVGAAGVSAFIVGFAFKDIAENFLAGVILAFNRPFHIDDTVQIKDLVGHVVALNLRTTLMRTFDGKHIFLPNSMVLKEPLINYTRDGDLRMDFLLTVELRPRRRPAVVTDIILDYLRTVPEVQAGLSSALRKPGKSRRHHRRPAGVLLGRRRGLPPRRAPTQKPPHADR